MLVVAGSPCVHQYLVLGGGVPALHTYEVLLWAVLCPGEIAMDMHLPYT